MTERGEDVEINRRAAESDLLVYVNVNLVAMDGGAQVGGDRPGVVQAACKHHHNAQTMVHSRSFMDHTELARCTTRPGGWAGCSPSTSRSSTIETTVNNDTFPVAVQVPDQARVGVVVKDQASILARQARPRPAAAEGRGTDLPAHPRRRTASPACTPARPRRCTTKTIAAVHRQQLVEVHGPVRRLVCGLPYLGPYNVNSIMNPILVTCMGLGYYFNLYRGQADRPPGRRGDPLPPGASEFHQLHHPSYVDFFEEVLAESTDPAAIEAKFEEQYATDPWYMHLYRNSHAYHGVHPFYMWYWGAHAMDHVGRRHLGRRRPKDAWRGWVSGPRRSLDDALEMARDTVGAQPVDHLPAQPAAHDRGRAMTGQRGAHEA